MMVYIFLYMVNDGESMGNIIGTLFPGWFVDDVSSRFSNKSNNF
jgi:hypothetical protein